MDESKPVSAQMAARPISPEEGSRRKDRRQRGRWWRSRQRRRRERIGRKGPNHGTPSSRFFGGGMFLTLLTERADPTRANTPSIQDAPRPLVFGATFLDVERAISGTAQGSSGVQRKGRAREPSGKGPFCPLWRTIHHGGSRFADRGRFAGRGRQTGGSWRAFSGAHSCWSQALAQFQTNIPQPLSEDRNKLLPTGGMRDPTVGILLAVFIRQRRLERSTMQRPIEDIFGTESR